MLPTQKLIFIFGTRPEAIKMAPLITLFKEYKDIFENVVVVTGQHREMLDQVLNIFNITPDYDLEVMQEEQTLSDIVVGALQRIENVILTENPDMIFVQGDTSTTFAAALAAFYHKIPVAHVEAGLRTGDKYRPFPEEINRKMTSAVADLHFAPTKRACENLLCEGISRNSIYITGNTVIDAVEAISSRELNLSKLGIDYNKKVILLTAHRRENFGLPMRNICEAVKKIISNYPNEVQIIMPVHMNPNVRRVVNEILGNMKEVILLDPLNYDELVQVMKVSYLILTDSGGIQEEAPAFGKPVLVLREVTERPEAVEAGVVRVIGTNTDAIVSETEKLIADPTEYKRMSKAINPYGDGHASERIVAAVLHHFGFTDRRPKEFGI